MSIGPKNAVVQVAKYLNIQAPPIRARELLALVIIGEDGDPGDAHERAEGRREQEFVRHLANDQASRNQFGRHCQWAFNEADEFLIQGAAFIVPGDSPEVVQHKNALARMDRYSEWLRTLSADDFERLVAGIIRFLGVESPSFTRVTGDQGIDVYGKLSTRILWPELEIWPTVTRQVNVWIIVQAKRSGGTMSTPVIRDLVGTVQLARAGAFSLTLPAVEVFNVRICDPVVHLFVTTGRLSTQSWTLLDASGVVGMEGEMVASFLAHHGVGLAAQANGELDFDEPTARDWLSAQRRIDAAN